MAIRSILKDPNKVNKYKSKKNIRFSKKNHIRIIPNKEDMKKEMIKGEKENKEVFKLFSKLIITFNSDVVLDNAWSRISFLERSSVTWISKILAPSPNAVNNGASSKK